MSLLQGFIIAMGLVGQVLVARKDARGYLAWIAGNLGLMVVYHQTDQAALIALQVFNTVFQAGALIAWRRESSRPGQRSNLVRYPELITHIPYPRGHRLRLQLAAGQSSTAHCRIPHGWHSDPT